MQFSKAPVAMAAAALLCALPAAASAQSTNYSGTPYSGSPLAVPAVFPAANFDKGGEGVAYRDLSSGNLGRLYRTGESVDIYASTDSAGGPYKVANFQTGEWMTYTINVPANGYYDIGIRAANDLETGASGAFRIEVDGVNVTGTVPVSNTGSWFTYQWFGKRGVPLTAGKHVVKLVSEKQWFDVSAISIQAGTAPAGYTGTPYSGTPIAAPAVFPAVNFDKGGEGVAYRDLSSGNLGRLYRTGESVDIYESTDSAGGPYKVANFQTGEWMTYTINVPANGNYDLGIRASNDLETGASGAFRIEVDGVNVTGTVPVSNTGSWFTYQWFGKRGVPLTAGKRVVKLVSEQQWFDVSAISVQASAGSPGTPGTPPPSGADTIAPSAPSGLKVSAVSPNGLTLSWNASTDNVGVTGYRVYRNGTLVTTTSGSTTSAAVTGLSPSTSYTFTVSAFDAAGNSSASLPLSAITPGLPLWSAGMEAGNLLEWYSGGGGGEHLGMDGSYYGNGRNPTVHPDGSSSRASQERSHSGSWSAKLSIPGTGGIRLWRWNEPIQNRELYYSAWFFIPQKYTVRSGGWNNIMQFKSSTRDGKNDPFFLLQWVNQGSNGAMYPSLYWWQPRTTEGPQRGQAGQRTWVFPVEMPIGRWFNIAVRYVCTGDFTGAIQVWQDGVELINLQNVKTGYSGGECAWAVTNYAQNISPSPYYFYVDDAIISRTRVGQ